MSTNIKFDELDFNSQRGEHIYFDYDNKKQTLWMRTKLYNYKFTTPRYKFDRTFEDEFTDVLDKILKNSKRMAILDKTLRYLQTNDLPKYGLSMIDNSWHIKHKYEADNEFLLNQLAKIMDYTCEFKKMIRNYEL